MSDLEEILASIPGPRKLSDNGSSNISGASAGGSILLQLSCSKQVPDANVDADAIANALLIAYLLLRCFFEP